MFCGIPSTIPSNGTKAMHGINLDLLGTTQHHPDGRPKDPHAHHKAELAALARAARREVWRKRFALLRSLIDRRSTSHPPQACPDQTL
jgi:hypothetical protein